MAKRSGFGLWGVLGLLCMACLVVYSLAGCTTQEEPEEEVVEEPAQRELVRMPLNDYTWDELKEISSRIAAAPNDEEGRAIAADFGLIEEDGTLTRQTKQIVLNGTRALDVRLVGIRHDDRADGQGKAGLSFMTVGALEIRPMNDVATVEGGWAGTALRAWLTGDAKAMFADELLQVIVPVNKFTNNVGITEDPASVGVTAEEFWPFSAREVVGEVHWDADEYQGKRGDYNIDRMLNAEGNQYEFFAEAGVNGSSDPNHVLSLEDSTGASPWWYRTPFPFDWVGYGPTGATGYFYQVQASGYPESLGSPEVPASVVVGFSV